MLKPQTAAGHMVTFALLPAERQHFLTLQLYTPGKRHQTH